MDKPIDRMSLSEVKAAQKRNDRALAALREKRSKGGRNPGATAAAIDRRRTAGIELCDRRRELLRSADGGAAYVPHGH